MAEATSQTLKPISGPSPSFSQPPASSTLQNTWSLVVGRKKKKQPAPQTPASAKADNAKGGRGPTKSGASAAQATPPKPKLGKPPRSAAVVLTAPEGASTSFLGEVLSYVRGRVALGPFGITDLRPRRALTGALILKVSGENSEARADKLYEAMLPLVLEKGARLARPIKTVDIRVRGLDEFISPTEIGDAMASAGGCRPTNVKIGQVCALPADCSLHGCPLVAAQKIMATGAIRVGWVRAPVEVLKRRPLQCHRCLWRGHVMSACTYTAPEEDQRGRCYQCGDRGHRVSTCPASAPKCPLCTDAWGEENVPRPPEKASGPPGP
ncbi:uncharacterized protein LOC109860445 [Pseudomyrmex gracilis]|uniref:uncharacterized protein LOC109860445 n=1 Tax=Pseudomyrmex gracilis TaxID=219809 RepID=UPI0009956D52|nr:uncharacterized protein LOC109860445 [Pseudomyrmex gracilis]